MAIVTIVLCLLCYWLGYRIGRVAAAIDRVKADCEKMVKPRGAA